MIKSEYAFILADFGEYGVSPMGLGYDERSISDPGKQRYRDVRSGLRWLKREPEELLRERIQRVDSDLSLPEQVLVAYELVAQYGYERLKDTWNRIAERLEEEGYGDYESLRPAHEEAIEELWDRLDPEVIEETIEGVKGGTLPSEACRDLLYELGALHDERGELYWGEEYFRERRSDIFQAWRRALERDLDSFLPEDVRPLSPVERDTVKDHILVQVDAQTVEDIKDTRNVSGYDAGEAIMEYLGEDRVHEIAREVARIDVEAIDVHTQIFDEDLEPLAPQIIEENLPDWDLDVLPEYIRETRSPDGDDEDTAVTETPGYDPDEPPVNPATPHDSSLSTQTARSLSPESAASRVNVPLDADTEASVYRIQRIEPEANAMLLVDTLESHLRWVQMDEDNPYHPVTADEFTQGNLILAGIRGGTTDDLLTVDPPAESTRWKLLAHERVADTTLTFYDGVTTTPEMVEGALQQAQSNESGWAVVSTLGLPDDQYQTEVRVPPPSADVDELFVEHLIGERVLEDLYDSLQGGDIPAQDIIIVRAAESAWFAILALGPNSTVVEEFHRVFRDDPAE